MDIFSTCVEILKKIKFKDLKTVILQYYNDIIMEFKKKISRKSKIKSYESNG